MIKPAKGIKTQGFSAAHPANDIANVLGTKVYAPAKGRINIAGWLGECGNAVQVGTETNGHRLCHLNKVHVKVGQTVQEGQQVGTMGYTGKVRPPGIFGTHLHWVMWKSGKRVDGLKELAKPANKPVYYRVRPGDTVDKISKKFKIPVKYGSKDPYKAFKNLNPKIKNINLIFPGQKVRVK